MTQVEIAFKAQTACPRCGVPRTTSPCHRCGVTWIPLPWTVVLSQWRARMEGYEAYKEARTEHDDGDGIWEYYSIKNWNNLLYWKDKFEKAEAALKEIVETCDDRFDRHEGYMSGLGHVGRVARKGLER